MSTSILHLAHPQPRRTYTTPPPLFHPHAHAPSSSTLIAPPSLIHSTSYPSGSSSSAYPSTPKHAHGSICSSSKSRPKPSKKLSSSMTKHKSVETNLKVKVERAQGFHAFFVPLARSMPPAPPSSPVLGSRTMAPSPPPGASPPSGEDYFDGWNHKQKVGQREQWVENVSEDESMEVDSE